MDVTNLDVKCDSCGIIVNPKGPKHTMLYGFAFAIVFALFFGLFIGGSIGIATAGLGIAATIPLGILGAYFGYKIGSWLAGILDGVSCPECGHYFG